MNEPAKPEFRRAMRLPHAAAMVIGTIIGASIFRQPAEITGHVPSVGGIFLVWGVAGLLTMAGSLVCAELASAYPKSGGVYVFLRESFGAPIGFLWGWAMFWTMHAGIIAAIAVVFANYTAWFVPAIDQRLVAVSVILVLSAINYVGVRQGATLQVLFTAGKLLAILAIIAVGFTLGPTEPLPPASPVTESVSVGTFALALVAGLFAFGGWHMVTYGAEETHDPERTLPRALIIGVLVVTVCYMALNAVYLYVLPLETVATSERIAADAADAVLGSGGGAMMSALVMFSTFGALAGIVLLGPRVYYAMARDGQVFSWLGAVHPTFRTPHHAIIAQAIWASVLAATGTYRALFTRVIYTEWIFFGLMAVGLMLLRRRPGYAPRYRMPGYPVVPVLFAAAAFGIAINQIVVEPVSSAIGLGLVLIGLPVHRIWTRRAALS
ncbi:MAG TPA: amino acid permease [Longimicrobiales bacterium]|nr:amino acid permease [Longimicrobiales bacterium]